MKDVTHEGRSVFARCPFYRRDDKISIGCEGLTDQSTIRQFFGSPEACTIQFETFCSNFYRNCEIYDAIVKAKYLGEGEQP